MEACPDCPECGEHLPPVSVCLAQAAEAIEDLGDGPVDLVCVPLILAIRQLERETFRRMLGARSAGAQDWVPALLEDVFEHLVHAQISVAGFHAAPGICQQRSAQQTAARHVATARDWWDTMSVLAGAGGGPEGVQ